MTPEILRLEATGRDSMASVPSHESQLAAEVGGSVKHYIIRRSIL